MPLLWIEMKNKGRRAGSPLPQLSSTSESLQRLPVTSEEKSCAFLLGKPRLILHRLIPERKLDVLATLFPGKGFLDWVKV